MTSLERSTTPDVTSDDGDDGTAVDNDDDDVDDADVDNDDIGTS